MMWMFILLFNIIWKQFLLLIIDKMDKGINKNKLLNATPGENEHRQWFGVKYARGTVSALSLSIIQVVATIEKKHAPRPSQIPSSSILFKESKGRQRKTSNPIGHPHIFERKDQKNRADTSQFISQPDRVFLVCT